MLYGTELEDIHILKVSSNLWGLFQSSSSFIKSAIIEFLSVKMNADDSVTWTIRLKDVGQRFAAVAL